MSVLADKRQSFNVFRKTYAHNRAIEENKTLLRKRYDSAKEMGLKVNEARSSINSLKGKIESLRVERANQGSEGGKSGEEEYDALESDLQSQVRTYKISYKENFSRLRNLKGDVERIQGQLQKQRVRMQKEFELWHRTMLRNIQDGGGSGSSGSSGASKTTIETKQQADEEPGQFLTGDKEVDRDILQFFAAKKALLKR
jgi:kinesin family protein 6/9